MGINGNTFTAMNRNPQIIRQATALFPDLIVISLGTNDSYGRNFNAEYVGSQIDKLVGLIRQYFPSQPLLLTTPIECSQTVRVRGRSVRQPHPNSRKVRDQILRIAAKYQLPVWDFFTVAGSEGAIARWYEAGLANSDRIHLTHEGYRLQGELLCDALIRAYNDYKGFSGNSAIAPNTHLIEKLPQIPLDEVVSTPQKRQ